MGNFFPLKRSQSPETWRKPVLKKVERFFDLENFLPRLALSHRNETHELQSPFHVIQTGRVHLLRLHVGGVSAFGIKLRYWDLDWSESREIFFPYK